MERPCTVRRELPAPLLLEGVTRTIGRGGAVVAIVGCNGSSFVAGDEVSVEIMLDTNVLFGQRCIRGKGVVARAEMQAAGALELTIDFDSVIFGPVSRTYPYVRPASNQVS